MIKVSVFIYKNTDAFFLSDYSLQETIQGGNMVTFILKGYSEKEEVIGILK